jgi:hypothetical protein
MSKEPTGQSADGQEGTWVARQPARLPSPSTSPPLEELVAANPVVQEALRLFQARIVSVRRLGSDDYERVLSLDARDITQLPLWLSNPEPGTDTP